MWKEKCIEELFAKHKHVTTKRFVDWLHASGHPPVESVEGLHKKDAFGASLGSRIDFESHAMPVTPKAVR
jgi:hypothetical protein